MCIYLDYIYTENPQTANADHMGYIDLKGRNSFHAKFWKWQHAVSKFGIKEYMLPFRYGTSKIRSLLPQCCSSNRLSKAVLLLQFFFVRLWFYIRRLFCHYLSLATPSPASILYESIAGRYRPVRVADWPIRARYSFM